MPRNRMIKVEFWNDEKLSTISRDARLVYIALWNFSDDYGVVKAHSVWLRSQIFPYEPSLSPQTLEKWLNELQAIGCIAVFEFEGENFYHIPHFLKHQKVNRPSSLRNPIPPDNINEDSLRAHGILTEGSSPKEKEKEKENIYSSEQVTYSEPPILTIPLLGKNGVDKTHPIFQKDIDEWSLVFPGLDVLSRLRLIRQWNCDNPKKRKTERGIRKHITGWLEKDQNSGKFKPVNTVRREYIT